MDKTILILGAGIYQVPLIKKAKSMGLKVVVCSIPGHYPGFQFADNVYYVNTKDKDACLAVAINERIAGVCTCGTDVALPSLGYINDKLGLFGPGEKAALLSSDKALMKDAFLANDVNTARYCIVCNLEECIAAVEKIGYPCILKITDSSGSRGMEVVRDRYSIPAAYNSVISNTSRSQIVVEEYLQGVEYGAQAFIDKGEVQFIMPHTDEVYMSDVGVPVAHNVPAILPSISDTIEESMKAIRSLNIDNCAVNLDFIYAKGKTYVLEVGARSGATGLAELVSIYYGVDYYKMVIETALGIYDSKSYDFTPKQSATSLLITSEHGGTIKSYCPLIDQSIVEFSLDYGIGDKVPAFKKGPDRLGHIIVKGSSQPETNSIAHQLVNNLHLEVE